MNLIQEFSKKTFIEALQAFYKGLNVPVNEISTVPAKAIDIISVNPLNTLIDDVYVYGIVNDDIFEENKSIKSIEEIKALKNEYDGILLFGITLHPRENNLLPTRNQLSDITRSFNRVFKFTPVSIVFKYGKYIAFANTERTQYKQDWRVGEKVGKVSLLRDIDTTNTHSGHQRILNNLTIERSGKNAINNFDGLYKYWQEVLSVSILNKVFYNELSNWYFWAIKEVKFPNEPLRIDFASDDIYDEAVKEHKGKNVIRLLTRILFIWFIKEKGLIPDELFDEKVISNRFIDDFTPQKPHGVFAQGKHNSKYYRAILQNLFFATLNQERGKREFRLDGKYQNATQLMRYKSYFKEPDYFIKLMEDNVPFMNGGLFECLDKPHPTAKGPKGGDLIIYNDGFSDRSDNNLIVPDFLFFDADEEVDLSAEYGSKNFKKSKTRGLINILKSYKFTITENTPIDEDVALDPELLGKVFENLLASYNPETKTTARKQTGSFYTPREIVNYMVEESLIAYLKNELLKEDAGIIELGKSQVQMFGNETKKSQLSMEVKVDESPYKDKEEELDVMLHQLVSFNEINPFKDLPAVQNKIIRALDNCKILDPACGSGAYPMGILQKMVHILHKIDPNNTEWKQRQIDRVNRAINELEQIDDAETKEKSIKELKVQIEDIEASFANNELDYGRKLYLIENCIYGVDIQPIATQISKLRFFISLVVDQKVDAAKYNFGIRPLPNLETKFVAANTLIGIEKPKKGQFTGSLFDDKVIKALEKELKNVRSKLFTIKTPSRKRELRERDKELREQISNLLVEDYGNDTARLLADWDPYDQNTSSSFFDKEWMFDITDGFDIVIGNPPYGVSIKGESRIKIINFLGRVPDYEIYYYFIEVSKKFLKRNGIKSYIIPNTFLFNVFASDYRLKLLNSWDINIVDCTAFKIFDGATVYNAITIFQNSLNQDFVKYKITKNANNFSELINNNNEIITKSNIIKNNQNWCLAFKLENKVLNLVIQIKEKSKKLIEFFPEISQGLIAYDKYQGQSEDIIKNRVFHFTTFAKPNLKKWLWGSDVNRYLVKWNEKEWIDYCKGIANPRNPKFFKGKRVLVREITNPTVFCGYTEEELYHDPANIVILNSDLFDIKILMAILNSKITTFYHFNSSPKATKGAFPKILVEDIRNFPLPIFSNSVKIKITDVVEKIILNKKNNIPSKQFETQIDLMVYKIYQLSYDEVLIVEPEFEMSREDYEKFKI
jgi:tRNA1(Val) A37 N6-methylase TrmN6